MLKSSQLEKMKILVEQGYSASQISNNLGISTATTYKYLSLLKNSPTNDILTKSPSLISNKLLPFLPSIDKRIDGGMHNTVKILREITNEGYNGSYGLLNKYINQKKEEKIKSQNKSYLRVETAPGEQAQVDWGSFGKISIDGRQLNLSVFVYVLSYSRIMYAEFVTTQAQAAFQKCHMNAFAKWGVPQNIRYDNVKTVVINRTRLTDGTENINYNFEFSNFARYYKFNIDVCPPYYPRAKGKVEAGVKFLRHNFMSGEKSGRTFKTLKELNQKLQDWLDNYANQRIHATTKEKPVDRWQKEKNNLSMVGEHNKYRISFMHSRYSSGYSMVTYKKNSYWIPEAYARKKINIMEDESNGLSKLYFYFKGEKIIEHVMSNKVGDWVYPSDYGAPNTKRDDPASVDQRLKNNPLYNIVVEKRKDDYYDQFIK